MKSDTQWVIDSMRVKTPASIRKLVRCPVVTSKGYYWSLALQPEILMLDEPTRGIDVGAKFEIYQLIAELAKKNKGSSLFPPRCRAAGYYRPYSGYEQRSCCRNC